MFDRNYFQEEYYTKVRSIKDIAQALQTYPNKVRRQAIKLGFTLRDKSEAQSLALSQGRHEHPTRGKHRDAATKLKISNGVAANWKNMSEDTREAISNRSRENWDNRSDADKQDMRSKAAKKIREASKHGSKLEKFIVEQIRNAGLTPEFHKQNLIPNEKMEIDIYVPEISTIIEIDGPTHFLPIWGEKNLQAHKMADSVKNGLLLSKGFVVIRVEHLQKTVSGRYKRLLWDAIYSNLKQIQAQYPAEQDRLIKVKVL